MMNKLVQIALCACITSLGITSSEAFAATKKPTFKITKVTVPTTVEQGTKTFTLTVLLSGSPVFPVTLAYYPVACPKGCTINNLTFLPLKEIYASRTNKLVVKNIKACTLINDPDSVFFDYAVSVRDKKGVIATPVKKGFTCTPN